LGCGIWHGFPELPSLQIIGVVMESVMVLRVVGGVDTMTADWALFPNRSEFMAIHGKFTISSSGVAVAVSAKGQRDRILAP
jgi:hypothetical protein